MFRPAAPGDLRRFLGGETLSEQVGRDIADQLRAEGFTNSFAGQTGKASPELLAGKQAALDAGLRAELRGPESQRRLTRSEQLCAAKEQLT